MEPSASQDSLQQALRGLPAVDQLLRHPAVATLLDDYPRGEVLACVRATLDDCRERLRTGAAPALDVPTLALGIRQRLYNRALPHLRRVINATGVVLHTGLGRAPLADAAIAAVAEVAHGYCNLEYDLESGRRGDRRDHVRELLQELCGAEDALVVNNNAGATYLTLHALAMGGEVIISRGQLVEIGGSYRLPDILAAAGCRLVEVGTTNRTRLADYERAVSDQTRVLLRVHTSNYRLVGFTEATPLAELVHLARQRGLVVVDDLGSGLLLREAHFGTDTATPFDEPKVTDSLATGADLALFSGDKLLGGPQAGIIVGRKDLITRLHKSPLARALRPGKLTLAALEATLRLYRDPAAAAGRIPVLRLLARRDEELRKAAEDLAEHLRRALPETDVRVQADYSEAGGGALPATRFPTHVVAFRPPGLAADAVSQALRNRDVPILCRLHEGALLFDPRTLEPEDLELIAPALAEAVCEAREQ